MPYTVVEFQPTPNPNALKCILDKPIDQGIRSFRSRAEASGDAIAAAMFAHTGVTSVLFGGGWMTVNKAPEAEWPKVKRHVQDVLKQAP